MGSENMGIPTSEKLKLFFFSNQCENKIMLNNQQCSF